MLHGDLDDALAALAWLRERDIGANVSAVGPAGATASRAATAGLAFERITTPGDH